MAYKMSEEERSYLAQYDIKAYEQPSLTVDIAVFAVRTDQEEGQTPADIRKDPPVRLSVLLVRRGSYPYRDLWALPGGFAKPGEDLQACAARELLEETSVKNAYLRPFGTFSAKDRDPRGWIISNGYLALLDPKDYRVHAGTDAWDARWFHLQIQKEDTDKTVTGTRAKLRTLYKLRLECPEVPEHLSARIEEERTFESHHETRTFHIIESTGLAFDHAQIILQAFLALQKETQQEGTIVFDLMPEKFTLNMLQETYEMILGRKLITPNFRRKIMPMVVQTEELVTGTGHRPAKLFMRNLEAFYAQE